MPSHCLYRGRPSGGKGYTPESKTNPQAEQANIKISISGQTGQLIDLDLKTDEPQDQQRQ